MVAKCEFLKLKCLFLICCFFVAGCKKLPVEEALYLKVKIERGMETRFVIEEVIYNPYRDVQMLKGNDVSAFGKHLMTDKIMQSLSTNFVLIVIKREEQRQRRLSPIAMYAIKDGWVGGADISLDELKNRLSAR